MDRFLFGVSATPSVRIIDRDRSLLEVAGMPVRILQEARNPADIDWRAQGVRIVVDTTGAFDDLGQRSRRRGARCAATSSPGPRRSSTAPRSRSRAGAPRMTACTLINGINHTAFDPVPPPPDLRRVLHDDRPRPHGQAATGEHAGGERDDRIDEHGARGHQLRRPCSTRCPAPARRTCARRAARSTAWCSTSTNAARALEEVIPRSARSGSWPTPCASRSRRSR